MGHRFKRFVFWSPRILGILFTIFISLFALDVFGEGYCLGGLLIALFIHLIPTYILLIALVLAWRWEGIGGLLFLLLGVSYFLFFNNQPNWITYLIIVGPLILIGALFIIAKFYHAKIQMSI
jgi:hypothetical protein